MLSLSWLTSCATPVSSLSEQALADAAVQGKGEAQYELARRLAAKSDYPQAMRWMQQAAEQDGALSATRTRRAEAALQVADWYQAGLGEPRNEQLAWTWWQRASRLGSGDAGYRLGTACQQQHGGKLVAECIDGFEAAAENGHTNAQLVLAQWYSSHGADKDAVRWLERAADQGNADAQYQLARRYEQGKGGVVRRDIAERLYYQAAQRGQPQAQFWLAEHAQGKDALYWYQKAAQGGEPDAQLWLAQAYLQGTGVPHDEQTGLAWLARAAAGGSHEAEYRLSTLQTNEAQQEHYLMLAAAGGYSKAQRELAERYHRRGQYQEARETYGAAARQGSPSAQLAYGEMLRLGQGGKEDYAEAFKQYRLAASVGNRMAQYRMGTMRQEGLGASRNRIHAYAWFSLAATEGMNDAINARNDLESGMRPEEIKAAQKLALHWEKKISAAERIEE